MAKNGSIGDLLAELKKKANLDEEIVKEIRVYSVQSGKIQKELPPSYPVSSVADFTQLFAERIPEDEHTVEEADRPIHAFHFDKEPHKVHGWPFKFFIKPVRSVYARSGLWLTSIRVRRSRTRKSGYPSVRASRASSSITSSLL